MIIINFLKNRKKKQKNVRPELQRYTKRQHFHIFRVKSFQSETEKKTTNNEINQLINQIRFMSTEEFFFFISRQSVRIKSELRGFFFHGNPRTISKRIAKAALFCCHHHHAQLIV